MITGLNPDERGIYLMKIYSVDLGRKSGACAYFGKELSWGWGMVAVSNYVYKNVYTGINGNYKIPCDENFSKYQLWRWMKFFKESIDTDGDVYIIERPSKPLIFKTRSGGYAINKEHDFQQWVYGAVLDYLSDYSGDEGYYGVDLDSSKVIIQPAQTKTACLELKELVKTGWWWNKQSPHVKDALAMIYWYLKIKNDNKNLALFIKEIKGRDECKEHNHLKANCHELYVNREDED